MKESMSETTSSSEKGSSAEEMMDGSRSGEAGQKQVEGVDSFGRSIGEISSEHSTTVAIKKPSIPSALDPSLSTSLDEIEGDDKEELEKRRLASRVSSRRTREREKLRLEHFRNAKTQLEFDNKKLQENNKQLRDLINKIKEGSAMNSLKAAVVQTLLSNRAGGTDGSSMNAGAGVSTGNATGGGATTSQLPQQQMNFLFGDTSSSTQSPALPQMMQQVSQLQGVNPLLLNMFAGMGNTAQSLQPSNSSLSQSQALQQILSAHQLSQQLPPPQVMQPGASDQQLLALLGLNPSLGSFLGNPLLQPQSSLRSDTSNIQQQALSSLLAAQSSTLQSSFPGGAGGSSQMHAGNNSNQNATLNQLMLALSSNNGRNNLGGPGKIFNNGGGQTPSGNGNQ